MIDRYKILEQLGKGQMGGVLHALALTTSVPA